MDMAHKERSYSQSFVDDSTQGRPKVQEPLRVIDLFCGAGGLSLAFHQAGFHIVAAVELDANAAATYRKSFVESRSPTTELLQLDISATDTQNKLLKVAKAAGNIDVLIGGPPCQDFSPARIKAERQAMRMSLLDHYLAVLKGLRPRAFLFENVPGLQSADDGRHWNRLSAAVRALGYSLSSELLNAEDFGVPQRRRRLFVVGLRDRAQAFSFPVGKEKAPTVMEAIGHLPALKAGETSVEDVQHGARRHRAETVKYLAKIPQGGAWRSCREERVLPCHEHHRGHYDVYGRMRGDAVAPTITGGCTNPSKGRFIHPTQHRGLTVREAALLQSFPGDWVFVGGIESRSLQVGNAVPVRLGQVLGEALAEVLRRRV